jgi:hypothetical protein
MSDQSRGRVRQDRVLLICPICGRSGLVRRTARRRVYCSAACKSRARSRRERGPEEDYEPSDWPPSGSLPDDLDADLAVDEPICCHVCGRPLGPDEDFRPWRVQAIRVSSLWHFEFRCICPLHFETEEPGKVSSKL